jgi:hypothetical protein
MGWLPDVLRYGQAGGIPWRREERLYLDGIRITKILCGHLHTRLAKRLCSEFARYIPTSHRVTVKRHLREVNFMLEGSKIRGLEQNPGTKPRWAKMAREGKKVM